VSERIDPAWIAERAGSRRPRLTLAGPINVIARAVVRTLLRRTRYGTLTVREGADSRTFGAASEGGPAVTVLVHDRRFYRALLRGSLGVSEAYTDRWFDCSELAELARLAALNMPALDRWRRAVRPLVAAPQAAASWCARNTPKRSRRRIAAHYDIGNDLFSLMLDETMTYSCAIFEEPAACCTTRRSPSSTASAASWNSGRRTTYSRSGAAGAVSRSMPPRATAAASQRRRSRPSSDAWSTSVLPPPACRIA